MKKNPHFKMQVRTYNNNGFWLGWDDTKSKKSAYQEEQYVPKKSEISNWFRNIYAPSESLKIDWQVGLYWGCVDSDGQRCEYRVVHRKDESEIKL